MAFVLPLSVVGQKSISPDKMISHIRDKGNSIALTIPGWFINFAGNIADNGMEDAEKEMVQELTDHIKKLRFVVSEKIPSDYNEKFKQMNLYMEKKSYEPLIAVREDDTKVNIWGNFEGDNIVNLVISVFENDESAVLLNIKSDLNLNRLQEMEFFKELAAKQSGIEPADTTNY